MATTIPPDQGEIMFGNDSRPSRIYGYDVRSISIGAEPLGEQLRLAHQYRNTLIALERGRRDSVSEVMKQRAPAIAAAEDAVRAAEQQVVDLENALRERNRIERKKVRATPAEKRALADARRGRRETRAEHKRLRGLFFADPESRSALDQIEEQYQVDRKAARNASGVFWGSYLLIDHAFQKISKGAPPKFRRWRGGKLARNLADALGCEFSEALAQLPLIEQLPEGSIGVQIQGGATWDQVCSRGHGQFEATVLPCGKKARMRIRVGSDPGSNRVPVWVEVIVQMDRFPPPDALIKWVQLTCRHAGPSVQFDLGLDWKLSLVLSRDAWPRADAPGQGVVGVDLNWRSFPRGLRVATAVGTDGQEHVLWLPRAWLSRWHFSYHLRSVRDRIFDRVRDALVGWIAAHRDTLPPWFLAQADHLSQWKSSARLRALVWVWKDRRFPEDSEVFPGMDLWREGHPRLTDLHGPGPMSVFDEMNSWRKQDIHLDDWASHQIDKAIRIRRDLYRKFAVKLRRAYQAAALEKINWREIEAIRPPDQDDLFAPRVYKRIAAPGLLAQFLREAMDEVIDRPPQNTTRSCHRCGQVDVFEAKSVEHTCSHCQATWDIDVNAAINLRDGNPAPVEVP